MQNELLSCAIRAALLAGKDILNIYDDPKADFAIERKADNSPLTIADKRSHARIMDELDATSIPVLGVIYVPVSRTLYFSEDSIGAYRIEDIDTRSAGLSPDDLMEQADRLPLEQADTKGFVVVASRSHLSPETEEYIRKLESEYGHVNLISCGSSLKICRVAEGSADIYPRFAPTMEWDTAAGHAIVRASGKNIYLTDERTPLHYNKENLLNPWFIVK